MRLPEIDHDSQATIAAAKGQAALAAGDTPRAREKYDEAAAHLEGKIAKARKQSEKHLFRFLAASQYYRGGNYQKALELSHGIEQRLLPPEVRQPFPDFFKDVKARTAADYEERITRKFVKLRASRKLQEILELLQQHPYVFAPAFMAHARAFICEEIKDYQAAALFYADAVRWNPADVAVIVSASLLPLELVSNNKFEEAHLYLRHLLANFPHAVTFMNAALLCFNQASTVAGKDRPQLYHDQVRFFEQARQAYESLPQEQAKHPHIHALMALAFETTSLALLRLGERNRAQKLADDAVNFDPKTPGPWEVRGQVTYPSEAAVADFQKSVALGTTNYLPYYFLAHNALTKKDFRAASALCEQAMRAGDRQNPRLKSKLFRWLAVCRHFLGADEKEVSQLFRKALEIDPPANNKDVERYSQLIRDAEKQKAADKPLALDVGEVDDKFLLDREARLRAAFQATDRIGHEGQAVQR